jgi:hypothetical protein
MTLEQIGMNELVRHQVQARQYTHCDWVQQGEGYTTTSPCEILWSTWQVHQNRAAFSLRKLDSKEVHHNIPVINLQNFREAP